MPDLDPRLVALYDDDNPDGPDHDLYRALADERGAAAIVDLGCGTGMLTTSLARPGRTVVGVDPSASSLAFARARPGADGVDWILGDSRSVPAGPFDLALMTGNVAQHIPDGEWRRTLRDLRAAMRDGATLAFESRNPLARAWERWDVPPAVRATAHGPLVESMTAEVVADGVVRITATNRFVDLDEIVVESQDLRFRGADELVADLESAGFAVEPLLGSWDRRPFADDDPLIVVVALAA